MRMNMKKFRLEINFIFDVKSAEMLSQRGAEMKITIEIGSNGIHETCTLDATDIRLHEIEFLKKIVLIVSDEQDKAINEA